MPSFGLSFIPGAGESDIQKPAGRPGGVSPIQEAVKLLSLRLPRVMGAQALAPAPLLNAPGGGAFGMPGGALAQILEQLFGQGRQQMFRPGAMPGAAGMAPSAMQAPPPRIIPGVREGEGRPGMTPPPRFEPSPGLPSWTPRPIPPGTVPSGGLGGAASAPQPPSMPDLLQSMFGPRGGPFA